MHSGNAANHRQLLSEDDPNLIDPHYLACYFKAFAFETAICLSFVGPVCGVKVIGADGKERTLKVCTFGSINTAVARQRQQRKHGGAGNYKKQYWNQNLMLAHGFCACHTVPALRFHSPPEAHNAITANAVPASAM